MLRRRALERGLALWRESATVARRPLVASAALQLASAQPQPIGVSDEGGEVFRRADMTYDLVPPRPKPSLDNLKFGTVFSDHMFLTEHAEGEGWARPAIRPFGPVALHPAAQVLHYGMCCFEGMKAYRGADGRTRLFRPEMNMARFHRSVRRLELANFDPAELLDCVKELLRVDASWLPAREGYSLYIRPFAFSSARALGIGKTSHTTISVVLSPVGPYFPSGLKPVSLFVDEVNSRAWPGGVGDRKLGGNYAPTVQVQVEAARRHGTQQVIYTCRDPSRPGEEAFEECGSMNVFFHMAQRDGSRVLATPELDGKILPGITRDSVLALARAWDECAVEERRVTLAEVKQAATEGRLLEVFGTGTACIVQPVAALVRGNGDVYRTSVDVAHPDSLAARLHAAMQDIYYGRVEHPWSVPVD
eukprot:scaffold7.g3728.t1